MEAIVRGAPNQYDLPDGNVEELAAFIANLVFSASESVTQRIQVIREVYIETKSSRLASPL
jgi:hypothetical protein